MDKNQIYQTVQVGSMLKVTIRRTGDFLQDIIRTSEVEKEIREKHSLVLIGLGQSDAFAHFDTQTVEEFRAECAAMPDLTYERIVQMAE